MMEGWKKAIGDGQGEVKNLMKRMTVLMGRVTELQDIIVERKHQRAEEESGEDGAGGATLGKEKEQREVRILERDFTCAVPGRLTCDL